jgi:hypothetical protein
MFDGGSEPRIPGALRPSCFARQFKCAPCLIIHIPRSAPRGEFLLFKETQRLDPTLLFCGGTYA